MYFFTILIYGVPRLVTRSSKMLSPDDEVGQ